MLYICIKAIMSNIASHITFQRCLFTQFVTSHVFPLPSCRTLTLPHNCLDALNRGYNVSGVYRILPDSGHPFDVYCDQVTDGGG